MTDLTLIKNELTTSMKLSDEEVESSSQIISAAAEHIFSILKDNKNENDASIVHLCAVSAYYQILLISQSDDVTSFKAGDVSYTRSSSDLDKVYRLYELALEQCSGLIGTAAADFAFKAV